MKHLEIIINASPDIIVLKDLHSRWIVTNNRTLEMFGIEDMDYKGKTDIELGEKYSLLKKSAPLFMQSDRITLESGKEMKTEEIIEINGQERYFEVIKIPIYDKKEDIEFILVIGRDITDRLLNERRYKSLFIEHPDAVYTIDKEGVFLELNKKAELISGYSKEELINTNFKSIISTEDLPVVLDAFEKVKTGYTQDYEAKVLTKDGKYREIHLTTIPAILNEKIIGIQGIAQDITEEKRVKTIKEIHSNLLSLIAFGEPLPTIYKEVITSFETICHEGICSIMLYEKEHNYLRIEYAPNLDKKFLKSLDKFPVGENNASCGQAAYKKELVIVSDIQNDASWKKWRKIALDNNIHACWSIPILSTKGNILGTFAVYYSKVQAPEEQDIELLIMLSYIIGLAMERNLDEQEIKYLALHDTLTDLPNIRYLKENFKEVVDQSFNKGISFAIMFLDLDKFKSINDTFGHSIGDLVLIEVGKRIKNQIGSKNIVSRLGGDEFIILIRQNSSEESFDYIAKKILTAIQEPIMIKNSLFHVTASIGISLYPNHGESMGILMQNADVAMYSVKSDGGNSSKIYNKKLNEKSYEKFMMQSELHNAIKNHEFELYYQPKIELQSKCVTGVEALIRWNHPSKGWISPSEFIPIAEESGLILEIGNWVIREACRQLQEWSRLGIKNLPVAVNVSIIQFIQQDIPSLLAKLTNKMNINPKLLEVEITESMLMKNEHILQNAVSRLKEMGIKVSIDDFGTGYASMTYLKQFRANKLKIDRSFIKSLPDNEEDAALVTAIISLAKALNMSVVAEGVETREQEEFLLTINCSEVQGYYYSHPLSAQAIIEFIGRPIS